MIEQDTEYKECDSSKDECNSVRFRPGDTVVFDSESFNPAFWESLAESERIRYYGVFGYGSEKIRLFTFVCEHKPQTGHCLLVDMETGLLIPMCHAGDFRIANEEEC